MQNRQKSLSILELFFKAFINVFHYRSKDYTAPVNFVSAGLRKTAAEEKQQQKQEASSDDGDDDGDRDDSPSAPPPPRSGAPKKLQMVKNTFMRPNYRSIWFCTSALP